jgi:hypothetical protein
VLPRAPRAAGYSLRRSPLPDRSCRPVLAVTLALPDLSRRPMPASTREHTPKQQLAQHAAVRRPLGCSLSTCSSSPAHRRPQRSRH